MSEAENETTRRMVEETETTEVEQPMDPASGDEQEPESTTPTE